MPKLDLILKLPIFANSLLDWLVAVIVAALAFSLLLLLRRIVRRFRGRLHESARLPPLRLLLEVLGRTASPFLLIVSVFVGLRTLTFGPLTARLLASAITIALFWQSGIWAVATVSAWFDRKRKLSLAQDRAALGSLGIIGVIVNAVIWGMVVLLTFENLGIDISALVAGLGIGGIAVALAVQNIFGDLFASLSITLDRPFVVGDFLIVDDILGSVETIGVKSTRLRSLSGEQIVMSNADLLKSRVRNYGRMIERRVVFTTSVTYETPVERVERIPALIRQAVESQPGTRFDRSHFAKHGAASLDFETVYYVLSPDYNRFMDIQQAINLSLHREFARLGIEFAYPTQKLFVASLSAQAAA